jgi:hypothetical protein
MPKTKSELTPAVESPLNYFILIKRPGGNAPEVACEIADYQAACEAYTAAFDNPQNSNCYVIMAVRQVSRMRLED